MNILVQQPQETLAWRIEFADQPVVGEAPQIKNPRNTWLRVQEVSTPTALLDNTPDASGNGLTFIFLPSGAATAYDLQRQAEAWMTSRPGEEGGILEVSFRSERVLWRRGRAICFGAAQAVEEVFAAVTQFSFCESEMTRLERQVQDCWANMDRDTALMKRLSWYNLRRRPDIDTMAKTAITMRMARVRLWAALETPPSYLAGPVRRLFLELALQADTDKRMEMMDDAIEVLSDFYTHMREQFSEFRHFIAEHRVSLLILLVLAAELMLSIGQIMRWFSP